MLAEKDSCVKRKTAETPPASQARAETLLLPHHTVFTRRQGCDRRV